MHMHFSVLAILRRVCFPPLCTEKQAYSSAGQAKWSNVLKTKKIMPLVLLWCCSNWRLVRKKGRFIIDENSLTAYVKGIWWWPLSSSGEQHIHIFRPVTTVVSSCLGNSSPILQIFSRCWKFPPKPRYKFEITPKNRMVMKKQFQPFQIEKFYSF